ncbi:MAG: M13 family metallopeptidase, partial [Thermoplasmata archaeon]|nr:M13 family metallopeptidase [Thermoplasmata archaeon]
NHLLIRKLFEELSGCDRSNSSARRAVHGFYTSAMDSARLEQLGLEPLRPDLAAIGNLTSSEELFRLVAEFHRKGLGGVFRSFVDPDKKESGLYAFYLSQGGLSLPNRDYYLEEKFSSKLEAYRAHLVRCFGLLGEEPSTAAASAGTVVSLERKLAEASRTRTELRETEKNYNKRSVGELEEAFPRTPWKRYFVESGLVEPRHVILGQPEFFEALDHLVGTIPLGEWKTYLRWHLLHGSARFLNEEVDRENFEFFHKVLLGQQEPEPRWLRAIRVLDSAVGEAVGELYVARHFPPEAKSRMAELVGDLRAVFGDRLRRLPWMTEPTRERALAKFDRFSTKIGHPDRYRDYSSIPIDAADYLGNYRRAAEFEHRRQMIRVGGPVDRTEWGMNPHEVNAYFDPTKNEIVFPAGILQPPFFDLAMDDAVNYGAIGAVIAHEITHGFDDQGRKYGPDGNLTEWWTEADLKEFESRATRVVEEYNGYEVLPGAHVNGGLTLGENIADIGGLSIALEALQRRLAREPARRRLVEGLTPEQRFFLSWAQVWRENVREDAARLRLTVDPHSPGRARAVGPARNLGAFVQAFGIEPGAPMWRDEAERIAIW